MLVGEEIKRKGRKMRVRISMVIFDFIEYYKVLLIFFKKKIY